MKDGHNIKHDMKTKFWLGLFTAINLVLYSGCAQAPPAPPPQGAYVTTPEDAPATATPETESVAAAPANVSPGTAEVIKLASSGVTEDVVLAFVTNSQYRYNLSAQDVVYLKDLGVSSEVVTAMINHDAALPAEVAVAAQPPPPPPQPSQAVEAPLTPQETVTEPPPADVSYFYDDLAPYGSWVVVSGVGWCWQPRACAISPGWRPYCNNGYWVYSDCGWYWRSTYSWGWAPFHYGRWYSDPHCGWVWCPDRVWGPAWVTWRTAGDTCGWAPLPPHAVFDFRTGWHYNGVRVGVGFDFGLHADHFTFIGVHDFTHHDLAHRVLPPTEVRNVFRQTTIVNNTTVVNNNIIVNRGVPVERVAAVTHTQIRPARLADAPAGTHRNGMTTGSSGATARGGTPVVYRHELPATPPPHPTRLTAQRVDDRHPVVRHTELPAVSATHNQAGAGAALQSPGRGTIGRPLPGTASATTPASNPARPGATRPQTGAAPGVTPRPGNAPSQPSRPAQSAPATAPRVSAAPADPFRAAPSTPAPRTQGDALSHGSPDRPVADNGRGHNARANSSAVEVPKAPHAAVEAPKIPKASMETPRPARPVYETPKRQAESPTPRSTDRHNESFHGRDFPAATPAPVAPPSTHGGSSMRLPPANIPAQTPHSAPPQTERYSAPRSERAQPSFSAPAPSAPRSAPPSASPKSDSGGGPGNSHKDR